MQINLSAENINVSILNSKGEVIFSHQNQGYQTVIDVAGLIKEGGNLGVLVAQAKKAFEESLNPTEAPKPLSFPEAVRRSIDASGV